MKSSFKKFKLKNGANVLLAPMANTEAITTLALLPLGSRCEKDNEAGSAHFIEHMLFKGTKKRPSNLVLSQELDVLGADYNAFTSREYTGYYIKILKENLENSLDILADIFFNSLFNEKEIEKEKGVILEEIKMYEDNPLLYISDLFYETFFHRHPLGRNIAGSLATVSSLNRQKLLSYKNDLYQPNNLWIVLAGAVKKSDLKLVEKYFGQLGAGEKRKFEKFTTHSHQPQIKVVQRQVEQVQLALGFTSLSYLEPQQETLDLLSIILGGNMSSRLFQEVRVKRGLAYAVGCGASSFNETGVFSIGAGVDKEKLNQALGVIIEELNKVKKSGVSLKELSQAKDFLIRKSKLALEDSMVAVSWYGDQALFLKKIETPEEKYKKIKKVTISQIKKIAQRIFDKNQITLAMVGQTQPAESYQRILAELK
jgi:predicted Zn-dependent peptidase